MEYGRRVEVPEWDLIGDPCKNADCKGVLVQTMRISTKMLFKQCSVCNSEFDHISAIDALDEAMVIFDQVLGAIDEETD